MVRSKVDFSESVLIKRARRKNARAVENLQMLKSLAVSNCRKSKRNDALAALVVECGDKNVELNDD